MKMKNYLIAAMLTLLSLGALAAGIPDDSDALRGVSKGKVVFDINMTEPKKMTLYLSVIKQTVDDLVRQNVEPEVILAFRGMSVRLVSKNRDQMELTDFEHLDKIAAQLAGLQKQGVRMEACSVATRLFKVDKLPINAQVQAFYNVVRPNDAATWTLRFQVQALFPTF